MSARRAPRAVLALLLFLTLGCGERAADPIVAAHSRHGSGGAPGGGSGGGSGSNAGGRSAGGGTADAAGGDSSGGEGSSTTTGPTGLCGACSSSSTCGDANDACIRHADESFCGRDCDEQRGCPVGYQCVELANSALFQCVPETTCPPPAPAPSLAELRSYVLGVVNNERLANGSSPLVASSCLDRLAQSSALDYARTDEPLGKYVKECDSIWPSCECGWSAEAELSVARYALDWQSAIDEGMSQAQDSQSRFNEAVLAADVTDIGIGFWISGDEAWLALSFR